MVVVSMESVVRGFGRRWRCAWSVCHECFHKRAPEWVEERARSWEAKVSLGCVCVCDKGCMVEREGVVKDRERRERSRRGRECGVWETVRPRRMPYVSGGRVVEQQPWSLSWWMGWFWEATNTVGYLCVWRCETNRPTWRKGKNHGPRRKGKEKREEREREKKHG